MADVKQRNAYADGVDPLLPPPLFSCPGQRNRQRPVPVSVTGVRYNSLLWMYTLNTLAWPDLTWGVGEFCQFFSMRYGISCGLRRSLSVSYWGFLISIFPTKGRKEGNVLFNDALNTFYLRLYGVTHMVKDHSDSERGNPLLPHRLLFPISSKGSFVCIIPQNALTTHGVMGRRIDPSWGGPIELFLVPASAPRLV